MHDHARDNRYDLDPECKKFLATKLDEILEKTYKFATKKTERFGISPRHIGKTDSDIGPPCRGFRARVMQFRYRSRAEESSASSGESGIRLFSNSELLADVPEPGVSLLSSLSKNEYLFPIFFEGSKLTESVRPCANSTG